MAPGSYVKAIVTVEWWGSIPNITLLALAQVISAQTDDITDLPAWFRGVENRYDKLEIPEKFRARLIHKYLSAKSRSLCARLDPEILDNYLQMKQAIMKEYGLTAKSFLGKYNSLKKGTNDTHVLFCSKLQGLLSGSWRQRL